MKSQIKTFKFMALAVLSIHTVWAQSTSSALGIVIVNQEEFTIKAAVLNEQTKINLSNDKTYKWYQAQKIMETKGGYSGKLLHGEYKEFYLNDQLKEKGQYRYGLKNKEWKYWYPDGQLRESITWKKGLRNGKYQLYNDYGQLVASGHFKNNKLHGKFYTYGNGGQILETKKYKNGVEVIKLEKQEHEVVSKS